MRTYKVILEDERGLKFKEIVKSNSLIEVFNKVNNTYYNIKNIQVFCVARSFDVVCEYFHSSNDEVFKGMSEKALCEMLNDILYKKRSSFFSDLLTPSSIVINGVRYGAKSIEQICNIMNKYGLKRKELKL